MFKKNISILLLFLSTILGYSSDNIIHIENLKTTYQKLTTEVPFFRYLNSREGLGYDYVLNIISSNINASDARIQSILNSSFTYFSNGKLEYKFFLEPDMLKLIGKLIKNNKGLFTGSSDVELFFEFLKYAYDAEINKDWKGFRAFGKNFAVKSTNTGIFINSPEGFYTRSDKNNLIEGQIKGILGDNNIWKFNSVIKNKILYTKFRTTGYTDSYEKFDIRTLENKKFFGDVFTFEKVKSSRLMNYIQEMFVPSDEQSKKVIGDVLSIFNDESYILVKSESMIDKNIRHIFFTSKYDEEFLEEKMKNYNFQNGKVGNLNYYLVSHEKAGVKLYIYYNNDFFFLSSDEPKHVANSISNTSSLRNFPAYKNLEKFEMKKYIIVYLQNYIEKKLDGGVTSFMNVIFDENNGIYTMDVIMK